MKLELTIDDAPVFAQEIDESTKANVIHAVTFMTRTQEVVLADRAARRATALAKIPEEERAAYLAVDALPEDERKLEYAKRHQVFLQAELTKVESTVAVMTSEIEAKAVMEKPIGTPLIKT